MEGVAGAFAVLSLAIQLVETGERISKFLTSVQDAPIEVTRLCQTVDQLNSTLKQVSYLLEQQYIVLRLPGSPVFITNALENCEKRIMTLEAVIQKAKSILDSRNRVQRSWASVRFVSKKDDIRELQSQLRDAEAGLQTAILSNTWQLQMHSISVFKPGALQATTIEQPSSLAELSNSTSRCEKVQKPFPTSRETFRTISTETNLVWYRGFLGSVDIQIKSHSLSRSKIYMPGKKAISEEKIIRIKPIILHKTLELRFLNSFGQITRTLSVYPILEHNAPVFRFCERGDLQGLQAALSSRTVSPFVLDNDGWSLLHYAAWFGRAELCAFLLRLGVDPNRMDILGRKAIIMIGQRTIYNKNTMTGQLSMLTDTKSALDATRLLLQTGNDISSSDMYDFWMRYRGPVEVAEFMFSQDLVQLDSSATDEEDIFPPLATALRAYSTQPSEWETFLRRLLRKGVDLHSPVRRETIKEIDDEIGSVYPCKLLDYGTPLDELFRNTQTPIEGEEAADRWLQILSSEGYDVMAYLEEESVLHAPQMQLTYPCADFLFYRWYKVPRQLVYRWSSNPSVSWDWWFDPKFSTYLLYEEFRHTNILRHPGSGSNRWQMLWPLRYPAWSDYRSNFEDLITHLNRQPLYERAQERANRRLTKKAVKAARAQGSKKRVRMPGAWPI